MRATSRVSCGGDRFQDFVRLEDGALSFVLLLRDSVRPERGPALVPAWLPGPSEHPVSFLPTVTITDHLDYGTMEVQQDNGVLPRSVEAMQVEVRLIPSDAIRGSGLENDVTMPLKSRQMRILPWAQPR